MATQASNWQGFYRGFRIERAGKAWEIRTGAGRTIHPSECFQQLYTPIQRAERQYMNLVATRPTRKAARAFADAKIARENR